MLVSTVRPGPARKLGPVCMYVSTACSMWEHGCMRQLLHPIGSWRYACFVIANANCSGNHPLVHLLHISCRNHMRPAASYYLLTYADVDQWASTGLILDHSQNNYEGWKKWWKFISAVSYCFALIRQQGRIEHLAGIAPQYTSIGWH